MANDNNELRSYLNPAQELDDKDVTCMYCKHFEEIGRKYCFLAYKDNDFDTPAYDCPYFEYMPKEKLEEIKKKKEEEKKKKEKKKEKKKYKEDDFTIKVDESSPQGRHPLFALVVFIFSFVSIGAFISQTNHNHGIAVDIVLGMIITFVLTYLAYKG